MKLFDNMITPKTGILKEIIDIVEAGYAAEQREDKVAEKVSFAPSSLGYQSGRCPRKWNMLFKQDFVSMNTNTARSVAVMDAGTEIHRNIQRFFGESGKELHSELEVTYDDPPIRGFVDSILKIQGEKIVVEIKSARKEVYEPKILSKKATPYQVYQLLIYMYILGINKGVMLYQNRNDGGLLAIPLTMTDRNRKVVEDALEWMRMVHQSFIDGETIERPWKKESINCSSCPIFDACWSEPDGDVKLKTMKVETF